MSTEPAGAMDVETAIRTRRTHKAFAPEPLAREEIDGCSSSPAGRRTTT
jgi:hypothetical protein